jgi:hypothetical protein
VNNSDYGLQKLNWCNLIWLFGGINALNSSDYHSINATGRIFEYNLNKSTRGNVSIEHLNEKQRQRKRRSMEHYFYPFQTDHSQYRYK